MIKGDMSGKRRLGFSIILNSTITILEVIIGLISGSLALLSDAGHNFSDVLSLALGYFGSSYSEKQPTKKHTFGYKRVEVLTSIANASALLIIGTFVIYEAINRLNSSIKIQPLLVIGTAIIALIGNLGSVYILNIGDEKSLNIRAVVLHLMMDSIASVGVVISGLMIYFFEFYLADIIISIIIGIFIFYSAYGVLKEGFHIMMQGVPLEIELGNLKEYLEDIDVIDSVHDLHAWSLSSNEKIMTCHVCLEDIEKEKDQVIREVEKGLIEEFGFDHITIQVEDKRVCETGNHSPSKIF